MNSKLLSRRLILRAIGLVLSLLPFNSARAEELTWQTDFVQASKDAAKEHKYILLDFTGSDWCPWCIKMDKEVFSQAEFSNFAAQNLILVKLDFPREAKQSAAEKKQNADLAKKYGIEGFPTYILLDPGGKEVRRQIGYLQGGATAVIDWLALPQVCLD